MREKMPQLVQEAGGEVIDNRFVVKPGIMVLDAGSGLTAEARKLIAKLNINTEQDSGMQVAELAARLTFFSFPKQPESLADAERFHSMLRKLGHLSPYDTMGGVSVLYAGLSAYTAAEVIANKGNIGRTSFSRTMAMVDPLFQVDGEPATDQMRQRKRIESALTNKREELEFLAKEAGYDTEKGQDILSQCRGILRAYLKLPPTGKLDPIQQKSFDDALERLNENDPGTKAVFLIDAKPARQWDWFLSGRLAEVNTVESKLTELLIRTANLLNPLIPKVIGPARSYLK